MQKYCKIIDNKKGLVQLGVGCSDEYYISIGMKKLDVTQSEIDDRWYLTNKCPHKSIDDIKQEKCITNDSKASEARYNQEFTVTIQDKECLFDTSEQTQRDLLTAFAVCSTGETYDGWITNNGIELNLTLQDIAIISQVFKEKSSVYQKWNEYKMAIEQAKTIDELQEIEISYE